jgi:hypothetical protein
LTIHNEKIIMRSVNKFFLILIFSAVALYISSCFGERNPKPKEGKVGTEGYELTLTNTKGQTKTLKGDSVDTNWDPASGLIYLGTDDNNEPLGTLTMTIFSPAANDSSRVITAILSTSDVKVGNSQQTNPRSYKLIGSAPYGIKVESIDETQITGEVNIQMERVIQNPQDEPETITLTGTFTAVN